MKRVNIGNGLKSCWSCGSASVDVRKDEESEKFKFVVCCKDCGEQTLNCKTKEIAIKAWNKAYEISLD